MDKKLEKYLQTVESELEGLREQQRESELREMRQHLEAIVARLQEGGLSREEAVEAAITQFGAARKVGRELKRADETREPLWRILLAPVAAAACAFGLGFVTVPLQSAVANVAMPWPVFLALYFAMLWPAFVVAGAVAGFISPNWGGRLSAGLLSAYILATMPVFMNGNITEADASVLVTLLSAGSGLFFGSRLAKRVAQRRTDAQRA